MQHAERIAKRRAGDIEGWEPWYYERLEGGLLIKGGVPRLITRGPRKGKKTWDKEQSQTVVVSAYDIEREYHRYETETGNCGKCLGKGKLVSSVSAKGTTYLECPKCGGHGKAPNVMYTPGGA